MITASVHAKPAPYCDLEVTGIGVSYAYQFPNPNPPHPAGFAIYGQVKNVGTGFCSATMMYLHYTNGTFKQSHSLLTRHLFPNEAAIVTMPYITPVNATYSVVVFANHIGNVTESNLANNYFRKTISVAT